MPGALRTECRVHIPPVVVNIVAFALAVAVAVNAATGVPQGLVDDYVRYDCCFERPSNATCGPDQVDDYFVHFLVISKWFMSSVLMAVALFPWSRRN